MRIRKQLSNVINQIIISKQDQLKDQQISQVLDEYKELDIKCSEILEKIKKRIENKEK